MADHESRTNLTDKSWYGWQVTLGSSITVPMEGNRPQLLTSRNFAHVRYVPETNTIGFYGGEIRSGEPILKFYTIVVIRVPRIVMAHNRITNEAGVELMAQGKPLGIGLQKWRSRCPHRRSPPQTSIKSRKLGRRRSQQQGAHQLRALLFWRFIT